MYRKVAPVDKPNTTRKVPNHLPNMKPPVRKIGVPKPQSKTQITVIKKNIRLDKIKLLFLIDSKVSLLAFINS
tara:strand:+ start:391 stop:609 length:219 start_codon:yes stop_codon:yes gene_type:complete